MAPDLIPHRGPRRYSRSLGALLVALGVHAIGVLVIQNSELRVLFQRVKHVAIEVVPPPSEPMPELPASTPVQTPPLKRPPMTQTPPLASPQPAAAVAPAPVAAPPAAPLPPAASDTLLRVPTGASTLDRVLGAGALLPASRASLERSLDLRVDGPSTDAAAAARSAVRALQRDLADDAVTAGLADDYFRSLKMHLETQWHPEMAQLNDGGASTTQMGMMRGLVQDTAAWGALWQAYLDLAKQYANGEQPRLQAPRRERLRELMRSRKGAFRVHAISEIKLTQDFEGKMLQLELPLPSGHPGIDDGLRAAMTQALHAMVDAPPARVHHGRSFSSWWRLRASWTMVPPTAFLTGAAFDVTPRGLTVDIPFEIKLTTQVLLLRTDARTSIAHEAAAAE